MIEGRRILRFPVSGISKISHLVRMLIQVLLCRCWTAVYKVDFTLRWMFRWVRFKYLSPITLDFAHTCAHVHTCMHIVTFESWSMKTSHTHTQGLLSCWLGWWRRLYDKQCGRPLALCVTTTCQQPRVQNLGPTTEFCCTLGWWEQMLLSLS